MNLPITVCTPSIPPRAALLNRALASIKAQTHPPQDTIVQQDFLRAGAAKTRQLALDKVTTPWVAFLDDDDEFLPNHLNVLYTYAMVTTADYVYSWYRVKGGQDPRPYGFKRPFDPCKPMQTTITTLVRTELAQATGFLAEQDEDLHSPDRHYAGEDWRFTKRCIDLDADIVHAPHKTWIWHHHASNTSGLPKNW